MQGWGQQRGWGQQGSWGQQGQQGQQQESWQQPQQQQQQQQGWQQQQSWGREQQQPQVAAAGAGGAQEVGQAQRFAISGCKHDVVGPIIRGEYTLAGSNHEKPAYKKEAASNGLVVMIYFWDERDGAASSGWWIGPQIGGNMVWGHNPNRTSATPPTTGWQAPHSAPADPSIVFTLGGGAAAQQQQMQQMQQGQQAQQGGWGQQAQQQPSWMQQQGQQAQQGQQGQHQNWMQQQQQMQQKGGAQQGWGGQASQGKGWNAQQSQQSQQYQQEQLQKQQAMMQAARLKQQQMEEQRRQVEEANKQRIAEQQAKIAEQRRIQQELQQKKIEEQRIKMEEMRRKQAETKSAALVRNAVLKLRVANPENFETLKEDLAKFLSEHLDACGSQKEAMQGEVDTALETASKKVEAIKEQREKAEAARLEAARKKQEAIEKAKALCVELVQLTEGAEESAKDFAEMSASFLQKPGLDNEDKVNRAAQPIEEAKTEAVNKIKACQEFLKGKAAELRSLPSAQVTPKKLAEAKKEGEDEAKEEGEKEEEAKKEAEPTQQLLQKIQIRIGAARSATDKEALSFKLAIQTALKKAAAMDEKKRIQAVFSKYDKDKDKLLNKREITVFTQREYNFTIPEEDFKAILGVLAPDGAKGVKADDFQALKAAVGVSRERAKDRERRAVREAREKEMAEQKEALQKTMEGVVSALKEAEQAVTEVHKTARGLPVEAKEMKAPAMLARAAEVEEAVSAAAEKVAAAVKQVEAFGADTEVDEELTKWLQIEKKKLVVQGKAHDAARTRAAAMVDKFKADANRKDAAEVKVVAAKVLNALKKYQASKTLSAGALFDEIAKGSDTFGPDEFVAFLKGLPEPEAEGEGEEKKAEPLPEGAELQRAFAVFDEDKAGAVSKAVLEAILIVLMKVVKDVALTQGMGIKDGKTVRRLEVGEVVQVLEGPVKEETMDVLRVKVKALNDDAEGWTTVTGNQGSIFLKEGVAFKVIKETILTESFDIEAPKEEARKIQQSTRKLKPGEIVDLRAPGRKQEDTGLTRMKCKVRSDGTVGYLTSIGNTGIKFVEVI